MSDKKVLQLKELDFSGKVSYTCISTEDAPYFRVGKKYIPCRGVLMDEDGDAWSEKPFSDSSTYAAVTCSGEVLFEEVPKVKETEEVRLLNVKIDLRKPDGSIDVEKNLAFQEAVTGNTLEQYCGYARAGTTLESLRKEFSNSPFLFVGSNGMLTLLSKEDDAYFRSHSYKEVNFEYERKLTYKATTKPVQTKEDLEKVKLKQELLLSRIENLEEELTKAHTKLGDL